MKAGAWTKTCGSAAADEELHVICMVQPGQFNGSSTSPILALGAMPTHKLTKFVLSFSFPYKNW